MSDAMNDTAVKVDQVEEEIFSSEVSDESLEVAAAARPNTTDWCAVTSKCTAPMETAFLAKSEGIS
jgi:hypothetical protein